MRVLESEERLMKLKLIYAAKGVIPWSGRKFGMRKIKEYRGRCRQPSQAASILLRKSVERML
jgi:hypothetical protein